MLQPAVADHLVALQRYARLLLGDRAEAEDLVQECLARALSRAHQWQPGTDLKAWLFTILHNLHVSAVRSRQLHVAVHGAVRSQAAADMAVPAQDARLALRDLERALLLIPDEQRRCLLLIGMEGASYEEAAAIVGVPLGTVMSRVARGREALRRYMEGSAAVPARRAHLRRVK